MYWVDALLSDTPKALIIRDVFCYNGQADVFSMLLTEAAPSMSSSGEPSELQRDQQVCFPILIVSAQNTQSAWKQNTSSRGPLSILKQD